MPSGDYNTYNQNGISIKGDYNNSSGNKCTISGDYNNVTGHSCVVKGDYNYVTGKGCEVSGDYNNISGDCCTYSGDYNNVTGSNCIFWVVMEITHQSRQYLAMTMVIIFKQFSEAMDQRLQQDFLMEMLRLSMEISFRDNTLQQDKLTQTTPRLHNQQHIHQHNHSKLNQNQKFQ